MNQSDFNYFYDGHISKLIEGTCQAIGIPLITLTKEKKNEIFMRYGEIKTKYKKKHPKIKKLDRHKLAAIWCNVFMSEKIFTDISDYKKDRLIYYFMNEFFAFQVSLGVLFMYMVYEALHFGDTERQRFLNENYISFPRPKNDKHFPEELHDPFIIDMLKNIRHSQEDHGEIDISQYATSMYLLETYTLNDYNLILDKEKRL